MCMYKNNVQFCFLMFLQILDDTKEKNASNICFFDKNENDKENPIIISSPELLGSQSKLIVYPSSRCRPLSVFQRSSPLKPLGQSKPNFIWSLLGKGERKFI